MSKTVGIVVVTEFCTPDSNKFQDYISYIDRDEAIRRENMDKYSLFGGYIDYVGNPQKASGLFTKEKEELSVEQKKALKELFKTAQENGSLMWQTVISFDNAWLKEHGYYDDEIGLMHEKRFVAAIRTGIGAMLKSEALDNAVWAADIHHNTDNIHVHVATVEPMPQREKKQYVQYEKVIENGKWKYKKQYNENTGKMEKIPLIGDDGLPIIREEFKGKFKNKSLKVCKAKIMGELAMTKEVNIDITRIIREKLINKDTISGLYYDVDFRHAFVDLYNKMPTGVSRNLWTYNSSIMKNLRPELDALTEKYIEKYHKDDFIALKRQLEALSDKYEKGYGGSNNHYIENKIDDIYTRIGNQILKEIRHLDDRMNKKAEPKEPLAQTAIEPAGDEVIHTDEGTEYIAWSENYKKAKALILDKQDYEKAHELLKEESGKGNALALYELGDIYRFGRGKKINQTTADKYYEEAFKIFKSIYEDDGSIKTNMKRYMAYRIGKMYNYGLGVEEDIHAAISWYEKAAAMGNEYAEYRLGVIYTSPKLQQEYGDRGFGYLKRAACRQNPYAHLKLGLLYYKGDVVDKDLSAAFEHLSKAQEGGIEFAADVIDTIKDRERRKIRNNRNFKVLDNRDLKMSLIYLRRALMASNEHFLNMKRYIEMMEEIEEES